MGNNIGTNINPTTTTTTDAPQFEHQNRVLFFLYRTWTIMIKEKWSRTRLTRPNTTTVISDDSFSDYDSKLSQYSFCSCSQCQRDDGFSSGCDSSLFGSVESCSGSSMAPNSEESTRIGQFPFMDDSFNNKDKQRPPIYNPEDYALSLKKWGRKPPNGGNGIALYSNPSSYDTECHRTRSNSFRDYRNPMLISSSSEMTLRQFCTVSELLTKLKSDLRLAYPSFIQEFVADPLDGITLLLDLLRAIQLSQSNGGPGSSGTAGKMPPSLQRRALLDELSCLQCLLSCCLRYSESVRKLTSSSAGLFTLAICIMSNVNKSRILALQLLTKACQLSPNGHTAVSEAMSTLRLRFGEPVRFRFLVGMLQSAGGQGDLLAAGMRFVNTFLDTAETSQKRLYIQAELEQAGFDIVAIKKNISISSSSAEQIFQELDQWEKKHLDVETLTIRLENTDSENDSLRDKVLLLERRIQILQEEKAILISLEQCLKDRCSELEEEVDSLKTGSKKSSSYRITKRKIKDEAKPEDEGISSSERSLTPEDLQRESSVYELYSVQSATVPMKSPPTTSSPNNLEQQQEELEEEETTIDEVIEELKNIINDAETEVYRNENKRLLQDNQSKRTDDRKLTTTIDGNRIQMHVVSNDSDYRDNETEIIPSNLHPLPPRKTKSLIHLFIPSEDYDYSNNKELFFENETAYTSDEDSDSLLSASKCQLPRIEKSISKCSRMKRTSSKTSIKRSESFRHLTKPQNVVKKHNSSDDTYYYNTPSVVLYYENRGEEPQVGRKADDRVKSKSLDRIDDGLDSMVDIVLTDHKVHEKSRTDLMTTATTTLSRSVSNVFTTNQRNVIKSKLGYQCYNEEKQKMFLPASKREQNEVLYYFPRLQEKRSNATITNSNSSSFLIKRGHANAGLYSGQVVRENQCNNNVVNKKNHQEFLSNTNSCNSRISGKVTDSPSGLY